MRLKQIQDNQRHNQALIRVDIAYTDRHVDTNPYSEDSH